MEMVHKFYDETTSAPRPPSASSEAVVNRDVPRLYVEAKANMKLLPAQQSLSLRRKRTPQSAGIRQITLNQKTAV